MDWSASPESWCRGWLLLVGEGRVRCRLTRLRIASAVRNAFIWVFVFGPIVASSQKSPVPEYAPTTQNPAYTISGVVLDPSEAVIAGARVTLYGKEGENPHPTTTGRAGEFRFTSVLSGSTTSKSRRKASMFCGAALRSGRARPLPCELSCPLQPYGRRSRSEHPKDN